MDRLIENLQHGDIGLAPDLEATDAILPANGAGGIYRTVGDDLFKAQPQREKLCKRGRQIADDTEAGLGQAAVQIRADDIGQYAFTHRALDKIEIEVTAGMTDVEDHAALLGFAHKRQKYFRDRR